MTTDAGTPRTEPIEDVVARDLSGWAESIYNCTTGSNYLRTQEHYDLIRDLDRYARSLTAAETDRDALRARVAGLEAALKPFANFACDEPCQCNNCIARALLAPSSEETK